MTRAVVALGCLVLASGCSVLEIPPPPEAIATNQCDSEDQNACGSGVCRSGACVARGRGEVTRVILEITPPTSPSSGGVPFYLHLAELTGGDIELDTVTHVKGKIRMPALRACNFQGSTEETVVREARDGSIPGRVTFTPTERALGMGVRSYSATVPIAEHEGVVSDIAAEHFFETDLAPGNYDVYVEPRAAAKSELDPACQLFPVLVRNQRITGDLEVQLPPPQVLNVVVRALPSDKSLEEWVVEVLDPTSGRLLSIRQPLPLGLDNVEGGAKEYRTQIHYSTPLTFGDDGMLVVNPLEGQEVVRLSPPSADSADPVFVYERKGVQILGDEAVLDLRLAGGNVVRTAPLLAPVKILGQTERVLDHFPVDATVVFLAEELDDLDPQTAVFVRSVDVGADGLFEVDVPPGVYRVWGYPKPELELATAQETWDIGRTPATQGGKSLEFGERIAIEGRALVSGSGGTAYGASVRATVTPWWVQGSLLASVGGELPAPPLALGELVGRNGEFSVGADPGVYDFFIQPEARSRYPWYVRPAMEVPPEGRSLGDFRVPFPVIHRGRVVMKENDSVVPGALIRVYAYVTTDGAYSATPRDSVVQIAEARTDEGGAFELLIPASLDARR